MQCVLADFAVSVSELKKSPSSTLARSAGMPVAIVSQNRIMAYLVSAELYEQILNRLDDFEFAAVVKARASKEVIAVQMEVL